MRHIWQINLKHHISFFFFNSNAILVLSTFCDLSIPSSLFGDFSEHIHTHKGGRKKTFQLKKGERKEKFARNAQKIRRFYLIWKKTKPNQQCHHNAVEGDISKIFLFIVKLNFLLCVSIRTERKERSSKKVPTKLSGRFFCAQEETVE